ncbi:MAG: methyl-accepting chemotaxis protein [Deltaproteobacteria bacterium]|nr:methyl-accepting chemotaxis protein [Deltaproteobacteria bacterium]
MKWPLRRKFYFAFGVIIAGLLLVIGLLINLLGNIEENTAEQRRMEELVRVGDLMHEQVVLATNEGQLYLFGKGAGGEEDELVTPVDRVHSFLDIYEALAQQLLTTIGDVEDVEARAMLEANLGEARTQATRYKEVFDTAVAAFEAFGSQDSGHLGAFRDRAREFEELSAGLSTSKMTLAFLRMRRAEQEYLLERQQEQVERAEQQAGVLRELVGSDVSDAATRQLLQEKIDAYLVSFKAAVAAKSEYEGLIQELSQVTANIGDTMDALHGFSEEARHSLEEENTRSSDFATTQLLIVFGLIIVFSIVVAQRISSVIVGAVTGLIEGTRKIASGDLTTLVQVKTTDELADLGSAFNQMTESLREISLQVNEAAAALVSTIGEMSTTVAEQAASLEQQAASVAETVATVEEITRTANQVSETATGVVGNASSSLAVSDQGKDAVDKSVEGMVGVRSQVEEIATTILDLSEKTQQIGTIIATVDDFAEQSSLLALNASIEAARAGEEGKAFSVVAGEVKNLAEQSRQATERVRAILSEIQQATHTAVMVTEEGSKRVERGVELIEGAGTIVEELAVTIRSSADSARQISAAAQQQAGGVSQIATAMAGIEEFSRQNLLAIRQTEQASQSVTAISEQLRASTSRYRLS